MTRELIELLIITLVIGAVWGLRKELEKSLKDEGHRQAIWRREEDS
jgi:hypothetical protein